LPVTPATVRFDRRDRLGPLHRAGRPSRYCSLCLAASDVSAVRRRLRLPFAVPRRKVPVRVSVFGDVWDF